MNKIKKPTILKIEDKEYPLIWKPRNTSSEGAYYCPELNFYFQRKVSGSYKVYKPHECERECPTSPCMKYIDICYGPSEDDLLEEDSDPEDKDHD